MQKKIIALSIIVSIYNYCPAIEVPDSVVVKYLTTIKPNDTFWDKNLGSLITGIISFTAVIVGAIVTYYGAKRNLERQLKTQLAISVQKEWNEKIRNIVFEILKSASESVSKTNAGINTPDSYFSQLEKLGDNGGLLQVYLDLSNRSEVELFLKIGELTLPILNREQVSAQDFKNKYDAIIVALNRLMKEKTNTKNF